MAKTQSFDLTPEDITLLDDYAYANRISKTRAVRYLVRTYCLPNALPHSGILLDEDNRQLVETLVRKLQGRGKPDGELYSLVVNQLVRRGSQK